MRSTIVILPLFSLIVTLAKNREKKKQNCANIIGEKRYLPISVCYRSGQAISRSAWYNANREGVQCSLPVGTFK